MTFNSFSSSLDYNEVAECTPYRDQETIYKFRKKKMKASDF